MFPVLFHVWDETQNIWKLAHIQHEGRHKGHQGSRSLLNTGLSAERQAFRKQYATPDHFVRRLWHQKRETKVEGLTPLTRFPTENIRILMCGNFNKSVCVFI